MLRSAPRSLRNPSVVADRLALLAGDGPTAALRDWSTAMATKRSVVVPHFDPTDAGVQARVLLLLEAPGPMTNAGNLRPGSGFISADNDDQTAENAWRARDKSGLTTGTIHWNIVPWYLGPASKKPNVSELAQGAMELRSLLQLLPKLRVVVLCGNYARDGWNKHVGPFVGSSYTTIETRHPSAQALNQPGKRAEFERAIKRAANLI